MNLVSFALRRPVTILVLVIAAILAGILAIQRMPRDVFPDLGVPVVTLTPEAAPRVAEVAPQPLRQ